MAAYDWTPLPSPTGSNWFMTTEARKQQPESVKAAKPWKNPVESNIIGPIEGLHSEGGGLTDYEAASQALDRTLTVTLAEEVEHLRFQLALEQESHKHTRIRRDEKVKALHARIDELSAEVESAHRNLDVLSAPKAFDIGKEREAMNLGGRISALGELARDFFNRTIFVR